MLHSFLIKQFYFINHLHTTISLGAHYLLGNRAQNKETYVYIFIQESLPKMYLCYTSGLLNMCSLSQNVPTQREYDEGKKVRKYFTPYTPLHLYT